MIWKRDIKPPEKHGDTRAFLFFAWLPTDTLGGLRVWLEWVRVVEGFGGVKVAKWREIYRIPESTHRLIAPMLADEKDAA